MIRKFLPAAATMILVGACATITAQTDDGRAGENIKTEEMSRYTEPGPEHDLLDKFRGEWIEQLEFYPEPGVEPEMLRVDIEYRWIMGGHFMQGQASAFFGGEPYKSRAVLGFDTYREEYTWHHLDNMSTAVLTGRGRYEAGTRTLVVEGTFDDVASNERDQPFRQSWRFTDDGTIHGTYETSGPGGKMYTRLKSTWSRPE